MAYLLKILVMYFLKVVTSVHLEENFTYSVSLLEALSPAIYVYSSVGPVSNSCDF